jgi:hypothetical protein
MPFLLPLLVLLLRMLLHLLLVRRGKHALKGLINSIAIRWVLKSQITTLWDMLKVNMMIHTGHVNPRYGQHELFRRVVVIHFESITAAATTYAAAFADFLTTAASAGLPATAASAAKVVPNMVNDAGCKWCVGAQTNGTLPTDMRTFG